MLIGHDAKIVGAGVDHVLAMWLQERGIELVTCDGVSRPTDAEMTSQYTKDLVESDWLVVDHYGLDASWETSVDKGAGRLLVIDDLADRRHACDALLDVGMHTVNRNPYTGLIEPETKVFFGPRYALIRDEFDGVQPRQRSGVVNRILVYVGGGLKSGSVLRTIALALESVDFSEMSVIFLASEEELNGIADLVLRNQHFRGVSPMVDMPTLLDWADLVIGTCGTSTWERLLFGVPTMCLVTAENQRSDAELLAAAGATVNLGESESVRMRDIVAMMTELRESPSSVQEMSVAGLELMKGRVSARKELLDLFATSR
jgi:UDP-2,4-diacetamido-2,4,6-trideoxy-beta-L-altropyranose hydrolase